MDNDNQLTDQELHELGLYRESQVKELSARKEADNIIARLEQKGLDKTQQMGTLKLMQQGFSESAAIAKVNPGRVDKENVGSRFRGAVEEPEDERTIRLSIKKEDEDKVNAPLVNNFVNNLKSNLEIAKGRMHESKTKYWQDK